MTTSTKLLTERELLGLLEWNTPKQILDELRERGLIAEEPVDPLLVEAREICAKQAEGNGAHNWAVECRAGECDTSDEVECAMIALRRGMELAPRKELTREMVRDAWCYTHDLHKSSLVSEDYVDRLHAALTEALQ